MEEIRRERRRLLGIVCIRIYSLVICVSPTTPLLFIFFANDLSALLLYLREILLYPLWITWPVYQKIIVTGLQLFFRCLSKNQLPCICAVKKNILLCLMEIQKKELYICSDNYRSNCNGVPPGRT